jgi:hypothetical protein
MRAFTLADFIVPSPSPEGAWKGRILDFSGAGTLADWSADMLL